jgi:predicted SnoaL-like aldol condensation-catalyzing enzyme
MNDIERGKPEEGQQETTGWDELAQKAGDWEKQAREAQQRYEQESASVHRPINLSKPKILDRDKDGNIVESHSHAVIERFCSMFNRYPEQQKEIAGAMQESLEKGKPLSVVNIGVAQGQEALGYIQMASDMAGEESIGDALDLELVEYAAQIPIVSLDSVEGRKSGISQSSVNYLKNLLDTPKAHFSTPFQEYAKSLKEKGDKRDVILFNNVIQHLDYDNTSKEQMREDMANLADIIADGGMICMTTNQYMKPDSPEATELFDDAVKIFEEKGLVGEVKNIGGAWSNIGQQAIFRKQK